MPPRTPHYGGLPRHLRLLRSVTESQPFLLSDDLDSPEEYQAAPPERNGVLEGQGGEGTAHLSPLLNSQTNGEESKVWGWLHSARAKTGTTD